ncbi:glutamine-hydrolyzing carbamoyl-phosphate synthase small subunit [bacterium]
MNVNKKPAIIALEDGIIFKGISFGASGEVCGEVVFNTSMTGYQEILTDPSYTEQIVTFTYPMIGNYGVNSQDVESKNIATSALIVRDYIENYSNWRADMSLGEYIKKNNIIGIEGIDTRALTRHIRIQGAMKAVISTECFDEQKLTQKANDYPGLVGRNLVEKVTCKESFIWEESKGNIEKIVVMDFGTKYNILRMLANLGYEVHVVPASTKADDILKLNPKAIMLTNGPGDPAPLTQIIEEVKKLIGKKPIFGICLGHQILSLALGAKTYKLKFGHRGGNHPVKDLLTQKVEITSQNHGFCVDMESLQDKDVEITHLNLYDGTLEGIKHKKYPLFSVQYHPEACPGPNDSDYLFLRFKEMINSV